MFENKPKKRVFSDMKNDMTFIVTVPKRVSTSAQSLIHALFYGDFWTMMTIELGRTETATGLPSLK
jgi:hypothetical protein